MRFLNEVTSTTTMKRQIKRGKLKIRPMSTIELRLHVTLIKPRKRSRSNRNYRNRKNSTRKRKKIVQCLNKSKGMSSNKLHKKKKNKSLIKSQRKK